MAAVTIDTFAALLEHRHTLACYCPGCRRWAATDLAGIVALGLGDRPIQAYRPLCRVCGSRGEWQVRPPMPAFTGATWMQ